MVSLLGMSLAVVAISDEPKSKGDPKPQWQRLLTGADARKAADLTKRIDELQAADKYAEAIRLREELLALRTQLQGGDHWETVDEKWALVDSKKVAALSEKKRAGWRQAFEGEVAGVRLQQKAQYDKALPLLSERLKWCREVLGENHPATAASYGNVAMNLNAQANYVAAGQLLQKALDIFRKVLGESHPSTALSYTNVAYNLHAQAKYAQAGPLLQKALDIRRKVLGEDHAHTARSYNGVAANLHAQGKYPAAEPLFQKALDIQRKVLGEEHPETAGTYNNLGMNLHRQGKYAEAAPLLQKALDISRKVLGEDHPHTAGSYNNLALNLNAQGKYAQAGPLYQKALDIRRKVRGENHPDTAQSYHNVAYNLYAQGKYGKAGPLYQKALDIRRRVLGEDHPDTATDYSGIAANLQAQAKYAEAGPLFQKALDIRRKLLGEEHPGTAVSYNSVALNLNAQGRYAEARPLFQKALDIRRKVLGEGHPDTAGSYNSVAVNLDAQEIYEEARTQYQKALEISRKVQGEDHPLTATIYNNVAHNLNARGKYAEAGPLYQKALDIRRNVLGEDHPDTANGYAGVAANLQAQRKYAEAGPLFQKALDICRKTLGDNHRHTALSYDILAANLHAQGKYKEALASLETAARSYEPARLSVAASGLERAVFGAKRSPYPFLAAARSRAGRAAEAWDALEANLARGLLDDMALRGGISRLTPLEERQQDELRAQEFPLETRILALVRKLQRTNTETAELERLIGQRRELEKSLAALAVAVSQRELAPLDQIQAALPADAAFIAWVDVADRSGGVDEHWGCVLRPKGDPRWERLPGSGSAGKWTKDDTDLPTQFQAALSQSAKASEIDALAKKLHGQRLAPLSKHLTGVKHLFAASVDRMAGIPIESLTDQYTISYTPSGTYLARIKDRPKPKSTGLLAVGDPVFPPASKDKPPPTDLPPGGLLLVQVLPGGPAANARLQAGDVLVAYAGEDLTSVEQLGKLIAAKGGEKTVVVKVWRKGQDKLAERELPSGKLGVAVSKEPARQAIIARRQADQLLAQIRRGESYTELPGAQVEISRLAELFDSKTVTTLTRENASEKRLDDLRRAGMLKQFRYLHLATHGKANNVSAFESALMLTRPAQLPAVRVGEPYLDGRLTAGEVLEYWKLDAELVTLSACESGLGRRGGGDGLLGFAQSFLIAGSRSVCLTLWQVDDTATVLLMDRFYRNLLGKGAGGKALRKAAALREAKQWLRTVKAAEALERIGTLTKGIVRGERPAREEMEAVPQPKNASTDYRPYAHPRYWAAFILIGDPE
jgi:tetratricopeptide (TPR) repeat protein